MSRRHEGIKRRVRARSLLSVLRLIPALFLAGGGVLLLTVSGCGGGGNSAPGAGQQQERSGDGSFSLAVAWPTRAADDSRQAGGGNILSATESLRIEVRDSGGFTDVHLVNRPPAGTPDSTIVVPFFGLRPGPVTLTATAFGGQNATGEVLGRSASTEQTGASGGTTPTVTLQVNGVINSVRELTIPDASQIFNSVTIDGQPVPVLTVGAPAVNLDAVTVDVLGNPVPVAQGREQWASSNNNFARVDANGVVTPVETGDVVITFTDLDSGKSGNRRLRVSRIRDIQAAPAVGTRLRLGFPANLTATPRDIAGNPLPLPPGASWQALNPNIAAVDANGVVTTVALGDATFEFRDPFSDRFVRTTLRVFDVGAPSITPAPVVINQGAGQELTLNLTDEQGNQFTPAGAWTSSNNNIASVQPVPATNRAQVTGLLPGTVTVTWTETVPQGLPKAPLTASVQVTVRGGDAEVTVQ